MMGLKMWILGVVGAGICSGIALSLSPKGRVKDVTRLVCGIVTVIALIKPAMDFDYSAFSANLAKYRMDMYELDINLEEENKEIARLIIEQESGAYILDKAQVLGLSDLAVYVTAKWGDEGYWYPYEVKIIFEGHDGDKAQLSRIIESDLGIPADRQVFSSE